MMQIRYVVNDNVPDIKRDPSRSFNPNIIGTLANFPSESNFAGSSARKLPLLPGASITGMKGSVFERRFCVV